MLGHHKDDECYVWEAHVYFLFAQIPFIVKAQAATPVTARLYVYGLKIRLWSQCLSYLRLWFQDLPFVKFLSQEFNFYYDLWAQRTMETTTPEFFFLIK